MAKIRIKLILFLTAGLCFVLSCICYGEPNAVAVETDANSEAASSQWQMDVNSWSQVGKTDNKQLFGSAIKAMLIVVILCIAIIFISKKFLPKMANLKGREIQIAETIHLGPKKYLHLIKIGDRKLLIGSTNDRITKLAELNDILSNPFESQFDLTEENNDQSAN